MKQNERLAEIETNLVMYEMQVTSEDALFLIDRVKRLTEALEEIAEEAEFGGDGQYSWASVAARKALEGK